MKERGVFDNKIVKDNVPDAMKIQALLPRLDALLRRGSKTQFSDKVWQEHLDKVYNIYVPVLGKTSQYNAGVADGVAQSLLALGDPPVIKEPGIPSPQVEQVIKGASKLFGDKLKPTDVDTQPNIPGR